MSNLKKYLFGQPIALVGLSGAGKSSVGRKLALKLKYKFFDSDEIIEKKCKLKIATIFEVKGEKTFRKIEKSVINSLLSGKIKRSVIALGGGSIEDRETKKLVLDNSIVIYLCCSVEKIYLRLKNKRDRPLMLSKEGRKMTKAELSKRIKMLLAKRESNYLRADIKVSTSNKSETEAANLIIEKLSRKYAGN